MTIMMQTHELLKFKQAVEQSPVSIVITNRNAEIEYVNPAFCRITGYSREEALSQNPRILQSGETPPATYEDMWRTLLAGREWRGELKNRRKSGEEIWEEVVIGPLCDAEGEITHFIAVKVDVTRQHNALEQLANYQKDLERVVDERTRDLLKALDEAHAAERSKDEFLANMSHEIRTPLNAIIGMTGLALRTQLDAPQRDYLEKVHDSGEHLLGLINDILDLSKITAGKLILEAVNFALPTQVSRVLAVLASRAVEKGLRLDTNIAPDVPIYVNGDMLRLNQVLMNLVGNAVKFTESGSVEVNIGVLERNDTTVLLEFAVKDSGIGMNAEEVGRLFRPFSQADSSVTRKYGGTGLGLAICKQLVEMMGGRISVTSERGKGSTFTFTLNLPYGKAPEAGDVASGNWLNFEADWRFENLHVLLADDFAMNRQVALELLEAVGITVDMAENGREAVDRLMESGPQYYDLVLMDIQMPVMDGMTATRLIRALPGFADLPVVAMTAHVMVEEIRRCLDAGMNDHIGKPFSPIDLIRMVATWVPAEKKHHAGSKFTTASATPAPAVSDTVIAAPAGLAAFDTKGALARFVGKTEKYYKWLDSFATTQSTAAHEIKQLILEGRIEDAMKRSHLIKGQAGTLGITGLQEAAGALERSLRDEATADLELERFANELKQAIMIITDNIPKQT